MKNSGLLIILSKLFLCFSINQSELSHPFLDGIKSKRAETADGVPSNPRRADNTVF